MNQVDERKKLFACSSLHERSKRQMIFPSIDLASTEQKSERKPADDDEMVVSPSEKLANSITATVAWPNGLDLEEPLTEPGENKQPEVEESCTGRNDVLLREMRNFHIRNDRN